MNKLLIIDGHCLAMRSHFAIVKTEGGLLSPQGIPINVCTGFLSGLGHLIKAVKPTHLLVAFDSGVPSFRSKIYPEYKANRKEKPVGFDKDLKCLQDILSSIGVNAIAVPGYEGDDIIASATKLAIEGKIIDSVIIYSSDKDLLQLLDEGRKVSIIKPDEEIIDWDNVVSDFGVKPTQIVDYKSLVGDISDNIKGAKGIGQKQTVAILESYGSVDNLLLNLDNLDKITASQATKIRNSVDSIKIAQKIVKLVSDLSIDLNLDLLRVEKINILDNKDKINNLGLASVCFKLATILQDIKLNYLAVVK